jgi:hypothetical protein
MAEQPQPAPKQVKFAEAVKLAGSKPDKGYERSDLLVKDQILEPHWHWSRNIGMPRQEAVALSKKFLEEFIFVGKEDQYKRPKEGKHEKRPARQTSPTTPAVGEPATSTPQPFLGSSTMVILFVDVFLAAISFVLWFELGLDGEELMDLIIADACVFAATIGGLVLLRSRRSGMSIQH